MNSIKKAFDGIQAEEKLKEDTLLFLKKVSQKNSNPYRKTSFVRYATMMACLAVVSFMGLLSYNLYFTPSSYIGMDVNPSIELSVNRFDRVIGVQAFNTEGTEVLSSLSLQNKRYDEAATLIIDSITDLGYWHTNGLVSVTVQTSDFNKENILLTTIKSRINLHMENHHTNGQVDVFSVDGDTLEHAHAESMSAAKYLAILELQEVDPTASMDNCRRHSVDEIRQMTQEHGGEHHGSFNTESDVSDSSSDSSFDDDAGQNDGHIPHRGHGGNGKHN